MHIAAYIEELERKFRAGFATEHTYRAALEALLGAAFAPADIINEPRQIACGAPDFLVARGGVTLGYVETKNLGEDLDDKKHAAQLKRYRDALDNLIFTDYLEFRWYKNGELAATVRLAELVDGHIRPDKKSFAGLRTLLQNFAAYDGRTIATADDLAERMAMKTRLLSRAITESLHDDVKNMERQTDDRALPGEFSAVKNILLQDLKLPLFCDMYAQTIAYGMLAARLRDAAPEDFTRQKAVELIPHSNPFLRKFFQNIVFDLDHRTRWIADDLANIFRATEVGELMKDFGKATHRTDPFLHFYETFLKQYDARMRKSRGVYYTPAPAVDFIVRAVDDILSTDFKLERGLANTGKTEIELTPPDTAKTSADEPPEKITAWVHKVQILDPAAGTGTFLAAIVRHIHENYFVAQRGVWRESARDDLIPRLHGFEIIMTAYVVAHIKLAMLLRETGAEVQDRRLQIYLTNSLQDHRGGPQESLFAQWLLQEAEGAKRIKRDLPVMVVIGNPPYAVESSNKGEWIVKLLKQYKQEPGGGKLQERNAKMLNDDYVKFIRYGQHLVEKTGEGVLAYISNNSFLDGAIFRGMRWNLLNCFNKIYILDLHGNARKQETAPDGGKDENVFDIMQGVSINIFVKTGDARPSQSLAQVFHAEIYGTRAGKFEFLNQHSLRSAKFKQLKPLAPHYFFVPKNFVSRRTYEKGFAVTEIFTNYVAGIDTCRDSITVHFDSVSLKRTVQDFVQLTEAQIAEKYQTRDTRDWSVSRAKKDVQDHIKITSVWQDIAYRPLDIRETFYTGRQCGFCCNPRHSIMQHMLQLKAGLIMQPTLQFNTGLITNRGSSKENGASVFIVDRIADAHIVDNKAYVFPLYIYPEPEDKKTNGDCVAETNGEYADKKKRKPNLDAKIVKKIAARIGLEFTDEKLADEKTFAPIDVLDYIYAVLHSPAYRKKYAEFLKIDFPRAPYPADAQQFRALVKLGGELRGTHLLQTPELQKFTLGYPIPGDHAVTKIKFAPAESDPQHGRVYINAKQYFTEVPIDAWNMRIGGYQPAQKWLKDRKGLNLNTQDVFHYQKIIGALIATRRLMREIDELGIV